MNIFGVLTMAGGLALFLYGMNVMGDSLAKLSGGKLEQILEKLTSKRIMAVLLGMAVTAVIQSSSATSSKSIPAYFLIASFMVRRSKGLLRSISIPL